MGIENPVHILFVAAVALVVLGPKRLPELARAAGKSMREFREALNGGVVEEQIGGQVVQQAPASPVGEIVQQAPTPPSGEVVRHDAVDDPAYPVRSPDAPDRGPL
jgi:sec-independent protein translocase protein TatA